MTFYFGMLGILLIIFFLTKRDVKLKYMIPFLVLFAIAALRGKTIGADNLNYIEYFIRYTTWGVDKLIQQKEFGYAIFNKLCSLLSKDFQVVLIMSSLFSLYGVFYLIKKNSKIYWLSIWLYITMYFYQNSFTRIRQAIAISFVLMAYHFAIKGNLVKFILLIGIAFSFHNTAIIALVIYPIIRIHFEKKHLFFYIPLITIMILLRKQIFELFWRIGKGRFDYYDDKSYFITGQGKGMFFVYILIFVFVICGIYMIKDRNGTMETKEKNFLVWCSAIAVVMQGMSSLFPLMNRLADYFIIPVFLLIPNIIYSKFNKKDCWAIIAGIIVITLLFFTYGLSNDHGYTVPYCWYFSS